jgi:hypothetical protein
MAMPGPIKPSHRGLLHKEMGIPEGHKISMGQLMKKKAHDKKSGNTAGLRRDVFAINARHWG